VRLVRDRREEILARLEDIFPTITGVMKTGRNVEDVSGGINYRPAIIMHDAAEEAVEWSNRPLGTVKELMALKPMILILWGDRTKIVATRVNELRRELIKQIWTDSILREIIGHKPCDIKYTGCGLDTFSGETREARMQLGFDFIYLLDTNELV
jgi:hypothetical protein